ncbi:hypothetical protein [Paenibacillus dakarensis]|uniref:hypothetical protein n=1 Tax=Paenibacillus dakarensis TaxID=1527293 RepID=UPI0006D5A30B|nr:hypothetical protein [Paenibacillus dakarensis]
MLKMKKRSRVIKAFSASMLLSLMIAGGAYADTEGVEKAAGAKTSPPPIEMNMNIMNPQGMYLTNTGSDIRQISTSMQLTATTSAAQVVDIIGVNYTFQRWTGSMWIDIEATAGSSTNTSNYNGTKSFSAASGYYYRGKTVHYIRVGTTYEEQINYTRSLLMQ